MARILVIGSLDFSQQKNKDFVAYLGEEIVTQGHDLLNGARNEFDRQVAQSVFDALSRRDLEPNKRLISYASADCQPTHELGTILKSKWGNWNNLALANLFFPETIQQADAVIIVGGNDGTLCAANWARFGHVPLLPITSLGGSAAALYDEELKNFNTKYADNVDRSEYEILNQISSDLKKIAKDAVSLAARIISSKQVFVIMSFSGDAKLEDAYESFQAVCQEYLYSCQRIDDANAVERILPEIFSKIKKAAFVIADLSEARPNVYYELGYAQGAQKSVIVTAFKGTPLPFDVADIPVIFWEGQKQLKERLRDKVKAIATTQGR